MQIKNLRIKSYRSQAIADTASEAAIARIKKLELYANSNQQAARRMPENHRLVEGDLLPLVKTLSTARLAWLGKPKPSSEAYAVANGGS